MTITTTDVKHVYEGTGAQTVFAIALEFFVNADIKVYLRNNAVTPFTETLKTENVHYTLTTVVDGLPTNVTMGTAPTNNSGGIGEQLIVVRSIPLTQMNTPTGTGVEVSLDRLASSIQELDERLDRTITLPLSSTLGQLELPIAANKFIKWNVGGTALTTETIDLTTMQATDVSLAAAIDVTEADIVLLKDRVTIVEAAITPIPAQIVALQNSVSSLGSIDTSLQNQITILLAAVNALSSTVSSLGTVFGSISTQTILNNQVTPLAITALVVDGDVYTSVIVEFELRRRTGSSSLHSVGLLNLVFRDNAVWETERGLTSFDVDGVTFTITTTAGNIGNIFYISNDLAGGGYSGALKMRIRKFEV